MLWEASYSLPTGSNHVYHHDLSSVTELQDIILPAGGLIIFEMNADTGAGYPSAINKFLATNGKNIIHRDNYVENDFANPDGLGKDCWVSLYDFAYLASRWLDCVDVDNVDCAVDVYP